MENKVIALCLIAAVIFSGCGGNKAAETMATDTTPKVETAEPEKTVTKIEPKQAEQPEEVETVEPEEPKAEQEPVKSNKKDIDYFLKAFEDAGYMPEDIDAPYFQQLGAIDGVMFYVENDVVKIYQFKDKKTIKSMIEVYPDMKTAPENDLFLCESSNSKYTEFFATIE